MGRQCRQGRVLLAGGGMNCHLLGAVTGYGEQEVLVVVVGGKPDDLSREDRKYSGERGDGEGKKGEEQLKQRCKSDERVQTKRWGLKNKQSDVPVSTDLEMERAETQNKVSAAQSGDCTCCISVGAIRLIMD